MTMIQPPPADARALADATAAAASDVRNDDIAPLSAVVDDDEEEEEMISLGLSVNDNTIEDGSSGIGSSVVGDSRRKHHTATIALPGNKNSKSAFPATHAASTVVYSQQSHHNESGENCGTGPVSVAQREQHRRTPGAGNGHELNDVGSLFCQLLFIRRLMSSLFEAEPFLLCLRHCLNCHVYPLTLICVDIGIITLFQEQELDRSHAETPIMSGGGSNRQGKTPHKLSVLPSSIVTPSNKPQNYSDAAVETPILYNSSSKGSAAMNQQTRQRQLYTPAHFTLAKNAELNMDHQRSDAFSPATIRMTDSLEKILTDDDDFVEARHRLIQQQTNAQSMQKEIGTSTNQIITATHHGNAAIFDSYSKDEEFDISDSNNGTFRRIQSMGYDSADDEMEDLGLSNIEETDGLSQNEAVEEEEDDEEDEEEAEISQINDNEDLNGENEVEAKPNVSFSRPKPLKFNRPLGQTSAGPISAMSASSGGAFKPAKRVAVSNTTAPRPQQTIPRNSTQPYQNSGAHYQNHDRDMYYPSQHVHGYFGHQQGEGRMDRGMEHHHPQHAAPNMLFNEHQSHQHLQYSHDQSNLQYGPLHQHHHSSPNYHLSPLPSPQNFGYGNIPTIGVVSPLTLPPDYSHGHSTYDYHTHANPTSVGRGSHPHHGMNNIHGGGIGGNNIWWRSNQPGHSTDFSMTPHHDQLQQQQQRVMGMLPVPGHTSPDYSYHEMMSMTPPYNLPNHHNVFPRGPPPTNANYYSHQIHQQHKLSPTYHNSVALGAARPRTKSKENNGPRVRNNHKPHSSSPTMHQRPLDGSMRPRKDSTASANSAFSGENELGDGYYVESLPSQNSYSASALRQNAPLSITNASSGDNLERTDWFYQTNRNNNGSYSAKGSRGDGAFFQHQQIDAPQRVQKGSFEFVGTEDSNNRIQQSYVEEMRVNQRELHGSAQPLRSRQLRLCPDYPPLKYGENERRSKDTTENEEGMPSRGEFVLESPSERQAFKEFGKQFRQKKNESLVAAREYALACLSESNRDIFLPSTMHWRVHLELADVAKRSNQSNTARSHYRQACALQPHASQGWLEYSKLEEESGNLRKCANILHEGLSHCAANENLLIMAIKFHERMGELDQARQLLSRLKHYSIDKSWKTMLEGALLEARAGRYTMVSVYRFVISTFFVTFIIIYLCFPTPIG